MGRLNGKKCFLITMIILTTCLMLVEFMTGYITYSMALMTDSFHMLSDSLALMVAYLSLLISPKQWKKNTFGWARAEVFGALVNTVFLIALCFSISIEACKRFISVETVREPSLIVFVGVLGLIVNVLGLFLYHDHTGGHGHSHGGISRFRTRLTQLVSMESINDASDVNESHDRNNVINRHSRNISSAGQMNMRGVYLHILADTFGSIVAIASGLIVWLTDWKYRNYMDPVMSLILVIVIMFSTWPLFYESALILLQTVPTHIEVNTLQEKLLKIDGVLAVHEFHVWQLTEDRIIATAHIRCQTLLGYMKIALQIKELFHNEGIHSTTIQPEFVETEINDDTIQIQVPIEDCVLDCPKSDNVKACQLRTCCGPSKKSFHAPLKDNIQCDDTTYIIIDAYPSQSRHSRGTRLETIYQEINE